MKAKKIISIMTGIVLSLMVGLSLQAAGEEGQMSEEMRAQMAKMKEFGTPGPEHAVLKAFEGNWTVKSRSWMKPGDNAQLSEATSSMTWVLDGRFLRQIYKGDWAGQPFEGMGFIGYDKMKKEYVSVWIDSTATGIFQSRGQYDAAKKTIKDSGTFSCPMTDEMDKWFRAEWKIVDKNTLSYSIYFKDEAGKEFKSMELTYKRAK